MFFKSNFPSAINKYTETFRRLESDNCSLNTTVEAYQESVRTKEELIMRFAEQQATNSKSAPPNRNLQSTGTYKAHRIPSGSQPIPLCTSRMKN
jgi:hypothetical protein